MLSLRGVLGKTLLKHVDMWQLNIQILLLDVALKAVGRREMVASLASTSVRRRLSQESNEGVYRNKHGSVSPFDHLMVLPSTVLFDLFEAIE